MIDNCECKQLDIIRCLLQSISNTPDDKKFLAMLMAESFINGMNATEQLKASASQEHKTAS